MFSLIQTKTTTFRLFGEDCGESPDRTSYVWKQPKRKFKVPMSNSNTENGAPIWDNRVFYSWWKKFLPLKTQSNSLDSTQNGSPGLYFSPVPLRASVHQCVCDGEWICTNTTAGLIPKKKNVIIELALLPLRNVIMSLILPFRKKKLRSNAKIKI